VHSLVLAVSFAVSLSLVHNESGKRPPILTLRTRVSHHVTMATAACYTSTQYSDQDGATEPTKFDHLYLANFLALRDICIIPPSELICSDSGEDLEGHIRGGNLAGVHELGSGKSMRVILSTWKEKAVALKMLRSRTPPAIDCMYYEMQIMTHHELCDHPNIVKLLGLSMIFNDVYVMVVEAALCHLGHFAENSVPLDRSLIHELIGDIADGLTILHTFGVVHGDIKPENILVFRTEQRMVAKISDFGECGININRVAPRSATRAWADPEYSGAANSKVGEVDRDIYSFGRVCRYLAQRGRDPPCRTLTELINETQKPVPDRLRSLSAVRKRLTGRYIRMF